VVSVTPLDANMELTALTPSLEQSVIVRQDTQVDFITSISHTTSAALISIA